MMHFIVEKQRTLRLKNHSKNKDLTKLEYNTYHLYYFPLVHFLIESVGSDYLASPAYQREQERA